jgi:hypothetical protein
MKKNHHRCCCSAAVERWAPVLAIAVLALVQIHNGHRSNTARDPRPLVVSDSWRQAGDRRDPVRQPLATARATAAPTWSPGNATATTTMKAKTTNPLVDTVMAAVEAYSNQSRVFYSVARTDRSGSSIRDMVVALAYGYAQGGSGGGSLLEYGGACYVKPIPVNAPKRQAEKVSLIASLGLQHVLKFACPDDYTGRQMVLPSRYMNRRTELVTPEFAEWLRSLRRTSNKDTSTTKSHSNGAVEAAVVHIRRGDVDPCQYRDRYLPSSYYVDVLDKYVPTNVPVTIYSESSSFESWGDFALLMRQGAAPSRNYTLRLDTSAAEVWEAVASARYVVMSMSSFAYVPALVNSLGANATIVYAPTWMMVPMPTWIRANDDIVARSRIEIVTLVAERCSKYTSVRPGRSSWNESRRRFL